MDTPIPDAQTSIATWVGGIVLSSVAGGVGWLFRLFRAHELKVAILEERLSAAVAASTTYHQVVMARLDRIEDKIDTLTAQEHNE